MSLPIILASKSPFRAAILKNAGLEFTVAASQIDERAVEAALEDSGSTPEDLALVLAEAKAQDVSERYPDAVVIGSDQTLSLGDEVFHKPGDMEAARAHLLRLSGKTHHLNSAVVIARRGETLWRHVSVARMTMRTLDPGFIGRHLARTGSVVLQSVGAYQFEGEGAQLFERIDGDYFTIVGLPLLPLLAELRSLGAIDG
ncbi:MAG: Maf-like protein [Phyllobacterium sp.]